MFHSRTTNFRWIERYFTDAATRPRAKLAADAFSTLKPPPHRSRIDLGCCCMNSRTTALCRTHRSLITALWASKESRIGTLTHSVPSWLKLVSGVRDSVPSFSVMPGPMLGVPARVRASSLSLPLRGESVGIFTSDNLGRRMWRDAVALQALDRWIETGEQQQVLGQSLLIGGGLEELVETRE